MERESIDQRYLNQVVALENEFFEVIDKGKPSQHRVLRSGKSIEEFDQRHGKIWQDHEAELIAEGLIQPSPPPLPSRDFAAEIDDLKTRMEKLEKK